MSGIPTPPPLIPLIKALESEPSSMKEVDDYLVTLYDIGKFRKRIVTKIKHIPQTGPNCGLAALAMISALTTKIYSIDDIFNEAKSRGFTYNGEMFSVLNMKVLAEVVLTPWFTVEMFTDGLIVNKSLVIKKLSEGGLMLIPYDADKNHSPCCKNGHKAHWALICGIMEATDGELHVAARHGKSRYLAVWSLDSLQRSNDNLAELDPERESDDKQYLVPPEGVREGLASRFILLTKNLQNSNS